MTRHFLLLALAFSLPSMASAQFSYSAADTLALSEVGFKNTFSGGLNPSFQDHHESFSVANPVVSAASNYTGTHDNGTTMIYNGTGSASIATGFQPASAGATFSIAAATTLTSGNGSGLYDPFTESFVQCQVLFTATTSGTYNLVATGTISNLTAPANFTFNGNLRDTTTNVETDFTVASNSTSLSPFSTQVNIVAGDSYSLGWGVTVFSTLSGMGGPASSGGALDGSVFLSAPEPCSLAALAIGGILLAKRRRSKK